MAKKNDKPEGLLIPPGDTRLIVIGAFRYYLGRMSAGVSGFGRWLEASWKELDGDTQAIIIRELEEAFEIDDQDRRKPANNFRRLFLGHDCDRAVWARIRALYRTPRCCLCGKEMGEGVAGSLHLDGERSCIECAPHECEVCEKSFEIGETAISNDGTRRARHYNCKAGA